MADQDHELARYRLEWLIRVCAECLQSDKTRTEMAKCNPALLYTLAMACDHYAIDFEYLKTHCGNDATDMIAQVLLKAIGVHEPKSMWAERERLNAERMARVPYVQMAGRANRTPQRFAQTERRSYAARGKVCEYSYQFDTHVILYRYLGVFTNNAVGRMFPKYWYSEVSTMTKEQIEAAMNVQRLPSNFVQHGVITGRLTPARKSEFGTFVHYAYDHGFQFDAHVIARRQSRPSNKLHDYNSIRCHHRYHPDCNCYACRVDKGLVR